jgi:hypothetical protein
MVLPTGFVSLLVLVAGVAGFEESLAYAAPLLVVLLPLLAGRFLGEERIPVSSLAHAGGCAAPRRCRSPRLGCGPPARFRAAGA